MFVLLSESMRRKYHRLYGATITLPDILLALRNCPVSAVNRRDYVYMAYWIGADLHPEEHFHAIDYSLAWTVVFAQASLDRNKLSNQPLSLSLVDDFLLDGLSWTLNWETRTRRFLLNHPASNFLASNYTDPKRFSVDSGYALNKGLMCTGLVVDVIRDTNEYMPPRRHRDYYNVSGDSSFFFVEWLEFAKENSDSTQADEDVLLDYTDTIQAKGCNHIWEQPISSKQDRLRDIRDFLDFLENPDAEEKNSIRLFYAACLPSHDRRFAITRNKHFCLVPKATRRGDLVWIPHGSRVPYIFRPQENGCGYQNIGETYVHDIMHGEANNIEGLEEEDFYLR
jgi:hypothetical protein